MSDAARIVDQWRDGLMDAAEERVVAERVAADTALRAEVLAECRLQWRLDGLLAEDRAEGIWRSIEEGLSWVGASPQPTLAEVERRLDAQRHRRSWFLTHPWMMAALAAGLLLVLVVRSWPSAPALRVIACTGEVRLERAGSADVLASGMVLRSADRITAGADGQADLALEDGSRLGLEADTSLSWTGTAHFILAEGAVTVQARPRTLGDPLVIATPQATTSVVGTRFRVEHRQGRSRLQVDEGAVRFAVPGADDRLVKAGEEALGPTPVEPGWRLVWADEFDRDGAPDAERWICEEGFQRNEELQWYLPRNAFVHAGCLVLEARRERVPNPEYDPASKDWRRRRAFAEFTSASVKSRMPPTWTYGRFEIRARFDAQQGLWPAIWTLGVDRPWPDCGEVDIMQFYHIDGIGHLLANAAWASPRAFHAEWASRRMPLERFTARDPAWASRFHCWRMDWSPDEIRLSVDGDLLNTVAVAQARNPDGSLPFREPHRLLLDMAVGSSGGDPSRTTFPARFTIDYVRVYQRESAAAAPPSATRR